MEAFQLRLWDGRIGRWLSIDPLAEEFPEHSPYCFVMNNPLRLTDPTGMAPEDVIDPPSKQTATQRAYNSKTGNTDIAKLVMYKIADVLESVNTYVREKIETSDKDIGSTATSKKGGGENQKTTGEKKGDNISADAFLDGAPGKAKSGNNLLSNKDLMNAGADVGRLSSKFDKAIKSVKEVVKENTNKDSKPMDMVYIVKDNKNPNNNIQVSRDVYNAQQKKKE